MDIDFFVSNLKSIDNPESMKTLMTELTQELRMKHFWYMRMSKSYVYQKTHLSIVLNDYPKEFAHGYLDKKRFTRCPVLYSAFNQKCHAACWNEIFDTSSLPSKFQEQLEWASQFDVTGGISCPIHGPNGEFTFLHFAINNRRHYSQSELLDTKDSLLILSSLIHQKISLLSPPEVGYHGVNLTNREFDCLLWAAKGKTVWETSQILNIAESTSREYMANCMTKLNASTKAEAVTKAIVLDLLKYTDIIAT